MQDKSDKLLNSLITTAIVTILTIPLEIVKTQQVYYSLLLMPVIFGTFYLLFGLKRLPKDSQDE